MSGRRRVAVVTGAASGIGAAIAAGLRSDGMDVVALDREHPDAAGGRSNSLAVRCDVRDEDEVAAAFERIRVWRRRIDVVVNAAGVLVRADVRDTTEEVWRAVLEVNLVGTFHVVRAAHPHLAEGGSGGVKRLINIGSGAAERGYAYPAYTASKGGVVAMTRQLAAELAPDGITVNAINPGIVRTGINDDVWRDDEVRSRWESTIPLGRVGEPEDVAAVARFLASAGSGYVTGQVIGVDGGRSAVSGRPA